MGYRHCGEHDAEVSFDGVAGAVVDGPGLQVVLGHPEGLLDAPELVVGIDDELRRLGGEVGGVALPSGLRPGLGLQGAVDALGRTAELDVAVALDRGVPVDGPLGLGDLFVDTAQGASGPVVAVLVVDDAIRDSAGFLR